jgi:hypothetical protein
MYSTLKTICGFKFRTPCCYLGPGVRFEHMLSCFKFKRNVYIELGSSTTPVGCTLMFNFVLCLCHRLLSELEWSGPQPVSSDALTKEQLKLVLPRKTRWEDHHSALFRWTMPKAAPKGKAKAKPKAKAVPEGPIASRTRKKAPAPD